MASISLLQYNDPLRITWRAGTVDDPYAAKTDSLKIINNRVVLSEIPSKADRVVITGYTEISEDLYRANNGVASNQFYVNYQNGIIDFNATEETKTIVCVYKGRGIIQYPAERIYARINGNIDVVNNLQNIIDTSQQKITDVTTAITNVNAAMALTINATTAANTASNNANLARDAANTAALKMGAKTIAFSINAIYFSGIQNVVIRFPFNGTITRISAFCVTPSTTINTQIAVEKISSANFDINGVWTNVLSNNMLINSNTKKASDVTTFSLPNVSLYDYFRINLIQADTNMKGLTIQIDIQL